MSASNYGCALGFLGRVAGRIVLKIRLKSKSTCLKEQV